MEYRGRYGIFDPSGIRTYPVSQRINKVKVDDLLRPEVVSGMCSSLPKGTVENIKVVAEEIVSCRKAGCPVVVFTGAHLIKNGLGPLLADLVRRGLITLLAGNGATAIHDFELALIGETSEYVPQALEKGRFGMAYEFSYINKAITVGDKNELGLGESLGKMICEKAFRDEVLAEVGRENSPGEFAHPEISVLAACYENGISFTVHVGIGTDVIDQHPSFDGRAKGGCSGRDFLIYTREIARMSRGGVVLNIGSAVTGPEVLLKAVSMAANVGKVPKGIITADFDLRKHSAEETTNETLEGYYFRDQKSVVARVPDAFGGKGFYAQGNQKQTVPLLYRMILEYVR